MSVPHFSSRMRAPPQTSPSHPCGPICLRLSFVDRPAMWDSHYCPSLLPLLTHFPPHQPSSSSLCLSPDPVSLHPSPHTENDQPSLVWFDRGKFYLTFEGKLSLHRLVCTHTLLKLICASSPLLFPGPALYFPFLPHSPLHPFTHAYSWQCPHLTTQLCILVFFYSVLLIAHYNFLSKP